MFPIDLKAAGGLQPTSARSSSSPITDSDASNASTEQNLACQRGSTRDGGPSSSRGSLTPSSSLGDLLEHEQLHIDQKDDATMQRRLEDFETELRSSRPAFLGFLKGIGLQKLSDRQRVANALSALLK